MSRWRAEPLRIALTPDALAVCAGGVVREAAISGQDAGAALVPLLDGLPGTRSAELVLSQRLVRMVLTPAPGQPLTAVEEEALVADSLAEIYGEAVAGWKVTVWSQPPEAGLVGAAIEAAWLDNVVGTLTRHGMRCRFARPLASLAARHLDLEAGWWALIEPGWMTLTARTKGLWRHLAAWPIDAGWRDALPGWIAREAALSGIDPGLPLAISLVGESCAPYDHRRGWRLLPHAQDTQGAAALLAV